jgi:hypothetical protein
MPVGIVFKGSGFYSTDHRSPSGASRSSSSTEKPSEGKKDSESKKESESGTSTSSNGKEIKS